MNSRRRILPLTCSLTPPTAYHRVTPERQHSCPFPAFAQPLSGRVVTVIRAEQRVAGTPITERPRQSGVRCTAPGSSSSNAAARGLKPHAHPAHSRQSDRRGISAQCPNPRPPAGCSPGDPSLHDLRRGYLPLFDRFLGTTTSSDFIAYMLGVWLLFPERARTGHG
jgi:hypothetical protein